MVRYNIRINIGDANRTVKFYFVHKDYQNKTEEEQQNDWQKAIDELNHIYKDYGRFATEAAVTSLFNNFKFERTMP